MLDNRDYMRVRYRGAGDAFWQRWPVVSMLIATLIVAFFLQYADFLAKILPYLRLTDEGLKHGFIWQLITFQFLHAGIEHLAGNLLALWFFGRSVESALGKAGFLKLYFLSGIAGGFLDWILMVSFPGKFGTGVVGASAGIFGVVAAFALIDPDATILVNFFIPVRAKYFLIIGLGVSLYFTLMPSGSKVAHPAHLGGILFGLAYMKLGLNSWGADRNWNFFRRKPAQRSRGSAPVPESILAKLKLGSESRNDAPPAKEFISSEVDPILDKISAHGIQSLTDKERKILQSARAKISKK